VYVNNPTLILQAQRLRGLKIGGAASCNFHNYFPTDTANFQQNSDRQLKSFDRVVKILILLFNVSNFAFLTKLFHKKNIFRQASQVLTYVYLGLFAANAGFSWQLQRGNAEKVPSTTAASVRRKVRLEPVSL